MKKTANTDIFSSYEEYLKQLDVSIGQYEDFLNTYLEGRPLNEDTSFSIRRAILGTVAGYLEGFTTLPVSKWLDVEPRNSFEAITSSIGHLLGFIGFIPGPGLLGKLGVSSFLRAAGLEKTALKFAEIEAKKLATYTTIKSVPMFLSDVIISKTIKSAPVRAAIKRLQEQTNSTLLNTLLSDEWKHVLGAGLHLGIASAISAKPIYDLSTESLINERLSAFGGGAIFGILNSALGELVYPGKKLDIMKLKYPETELKYSELKRANPTEYAKVFKESERANAVARALTSALLFGGMSTLEGAPPAIQVYEYLLNAYFGAKEMPINIKKAKAVFEAYSKHPYYRALLLEPSKIPGYESFTPDTKEALENLSYMEFNRYIGGEGNHSVGMLKAILEQAQFTPDEINQIKEELKSNKGITQIFNELKTKINDKNIDRIYKDKLSGLKDILRESKVALQLEEEVKKYGELDAKIENLKAKAASIIEEDVNLNFLNDTHEVILDELMEKFANEKGVDAGTIAQLRKLASDAVGYFHDRLTPGSIYLLDSFMDKTVDSLGLKKTGNIVSYFSGYYEAFKSTGDLILSFAKNKNIDYKTFHQEFTNILKRSFSGKVKEELTPEKFEELSKDIKYLYTTLKQSTPFRRGTINFDTGQIEVEETPTLGGKSVLEGILENLTKPPEKPIKLQETVYHTGDKPRITAENPYGISQPESQKIEIKPPVNVETTEKIEAPKPELPVQLYDLEKVVISNREIELDRLALEIERFDGQRDISAFYYGNEARFPILTTLRKLLPEDKKNVVGNKIKYVKNNEVPEDKRKQIAKEISDIYLVNFIERIYTSGSPDRPKIFLSGVKDKPRAIVLDGSLVKKEDVKGIRDTFLNDPEVSQSYKDAYYQGLKEWTDALGSREIYDHLFVNNMAFIAKFNFPDLPIVEAIKKINPKDFVVSPSAINQRMQMIHERAIRPEVEEVKRLLNKTENHVNFVILHTNNTDGSNPYPNLIETRENGYYLKTEKGEHKLEAHRDGSVFITRELYNALLKSVGFEEKGGHYKGSLVFDGGRPEAESKGGFIGKLAYHVMDADLEEAAKKLGVDIIFFDTATKQAGLRKSYDWMFDPENKEIRIKSTEPVEVYKAPIDAITIRDVEKIEKLKEKVTLPKQLMQNIMSIFEGGDEAKKALYDHYLVGALQSLKQKINILIKNDYKSEEFQKVVKEILTPDDEQTITSFDGTTPRELERYFEKQLQYRGIAEYILGVNQELTPALLQFPGFKEYFSVRLRRWILDNIVSPKVDNGHLAVMTPHDPASVYKAGGLKQGEVLLDKGLREKEITLTLPSGEKVKGKLGELYDKYYESNPELFEIVMIRTPADSPASVRIAKVKGFRDVDGTGITIHPLDMIHMGGADTDWDKAFIFFDMPKAVKDYYNKHSEDFFVEKEIDGVKQKVFREQKTNKDFLREVPKLYPFSPLSQFRVSMDAIGGNQSLGPILAYANRLKEVLIEVAKGKDPIEVLEPEGVVEKDGIYALKVGKNEVEFDLLYREDVDKFMFDIVDAINYSADASKGYPMKDPYTIRKYLFEDLFDVVIHSGPDNERTRNYIIQHIMNKSLRLREQMYIDQVINGRYATAGTALRIIEPKYQYNTLFYQSLKEMFQSDRNYPGLKEALDILYNNWVGPGEVQIRKLANILATENPDLYGRGKKLSDEDYKVREAFINFMKEKLGLNVKEIKYIVRKFFNPLPYDPKNEVYGKELLRNDMLDISSILLTLEKAAALKTKVEAVLFKGGIRKERITEQFKNIVDDLGINAENFKSRFRRIIHGGGERAEQIEALKKEVNEYRNELAKKYEGSYGKEVVDFFDTILISSLRYKSRGLKSIAKSDIDSFNRLNNFIRASVRSRLGDIKLPSVRNYSYEDVDNLIGAIRKAYQEKYGVTEDAYILELDSYETKLKELVKNIRGKAESYFASQQYSVFIDIVPKDILKEYINKFTKVIEYTYETSVPIPSSPFSLTLEPKLVQTDRPDLAERYGFTSVESDYSNALTILNTNKNLLLDVFKKKFNYYKNVFSKISAKKGSDSKSKGKEVSFKTPEDIYVALQRLIKNNDKSVSEIITALDIFGNLKDIDKVIIVGAGGEKEIAFYKQFLLDLIHNKRENEWYKQANSKIYFFNTKSIYSQEKPTGRVEEREMLAPYSWYKLGFRVDKIEFIPLEKSEVSSVSYVSTKGKNYIFVGNEIDKGFGFNKVFTEMLFNTSRHLSVFKGLYNLEGIKNLILENKVGDKVILLDKDNPNHVALYNLYSRKLGDKLRLVDESFEPLGYEQYVVPNDMPSEIMVKLASIEYTPDFRKIKLLDSSEEVTKLLSRMYYNKEILKDIDRLTKKKEEVLANIKKYEKELEDEKQKLIKTIEELTNPEKKEKEEVSQYPSYLEGKEMLVRALEEDIISKSLTSEGQETYQKTKEILNKYPAFAKTFDKMWIAYQISRGKIPIAFDIAKESEIKQFVDELYTAVQNRNPKLSKLDWFLPMDLIEEKMKLTDINFTTKKVAIITRDGIMEMEVELPTSSMERLHKLGSIFNDAINRKFAEVTQYIKDSHVAAILNESDPKKREELQALFEYSLVELEEFYINGLLEPSIRMGMPRWQEFEKIRKRFYETKNAKREKVEHLLSKTYTVTDKEGNTVQMSGNDLLDLFKNFAQETTYERVYKNVLINPKAEEEFLIKYTIPGTKWIDFDKVNSILIPEIIGKNKVPDLSFRLLQMMAQQFAVQTRRYKIISTDPETGEKIEDFVTPLDIKDLNKRKEMLDYLAGLTKKEIYEDGTVEEQLVYPSVSQSTKLWEGLNPIYAAHYVPHMNFDIIAIEKTIKEEIDELTKDFENKRITVEEYQKKKLKLELIKQRMLGEKSLNYQEFGQQTIAEVLGKKDFGEEEINKLNVIPSFFKSRDVYFPHWDTRFEIYDRYLKGVYKGVLDNFFAILGNINNYMFEYKFKNGIETGYTEKEAKVWRYFMDTYVRDIIGYPAFMSDEVINDPDYKIKGNFYWKLTEDYWARKKGPIIDKFFGLEDKMPEELRKEIIARKLISLSTLEGKMSLVTLLSTPKTYFVNRFTGTINTLISAGIEPLVKSKSLTHLRTINPNWKTMDDVYKDLERLGAVESFILGEFANRQRFSDINWENITANLSKIFLQTRNREKFITYAKDYLSKEGLLEAVTDLASVFMRFSEIQNRREAFLAHYLKARQVFEATNHTFEWNDPWLIEMARRGVKASQFLYDNIERGAFARTALGRMLTRFQLFTINSIIFRRDILRDFVNAGFKEGTYEYDKFARLAAMDMLVFSLGSLLPYSLFNAALSPPWNYFQDLAEWLFGDEKDKEKAFYGILPYPLNIVQPVLPPSTRYFTGLFNALFFDQMDKFASYQIWTWFPFGRLVNDIRRNIDNPYMMVDRTLGIPLVDLTRLVSESKKESLKENQ